MERPGELVQVDCFRIGRLRRTKGFVWQYTAIDVGSAYGWAELHVPPHNPAARSCLSVVQRVARDLERFGWKMEAVMTGDGGEFRARAFRDTVHELGAERRFIRSGRPQATGCVERFQGTIPEEGRKPSFARSLLPGRQALDEGLKSSGR